MDSHKLTGTLLLLAIVSLVVPARAVTYRATLLHSAGFDESYALGVSSTNQVGYGSGSPTGDEMHALLWTGTATSVVDLNPTGFVRSFAHSASGAAQVGSGRTLSGGLNQALLWYGTAASAVNLNSAGFNDCQALGVSVASQVGWGNGPATAFQDHALMWQGTAASVVDLHPAGFYESAAYDVSGTTQVGFANTEGGPSQALMWKGTGASVVNLNPTGFNFSQAVGVSGATQVGYGRTGNNYHALLWSGTAASAVDLHPDGFIASYARDVSDAIQVGDGWGSATEFSPHALLWNGTAASVLDLHPFLSELGPTFIESFANSVAENGTIVGYARDANSTTYAVLWTPVPEPGASTLMLCSLAVAFVPRLRRHRK